MTGFSVVVCTYNPDNRIFSRLIHALDQLQVPVDVPVEFIVVDNNSLQPVDEKDFVKNFLQAKANRKCVKEKEPGLTAARQRGYHEARYNWLVYFDDDNEPGTAFLTELEKATRQFPEVRCWGPAEISVELLDTPVHAWVQQKKFYFQERNWEKTNFGIHAIWQSYFPYGTGLVVHRDIMTEYVRRIKDGRYSLSDRKGKSLTSGGDLQIVLTATNLNHPAGTVHGMVVNHMIVPQKSTVNYLERQVYGTASSYVAAHKQADPSIEMDLHLATDKEMIKRIYLTIRRCLFRTTLNDFRLEMADLMGGINARYVFCNENRKPIILRLYEKLINA